MLKIHAKFPVSGTSTTFIQVEEGIKLERVSLLLNQPFVQYSIQPPLTRHFYHVDQIEFKNPTEVTVSFLPLIEKRLKLFHLSYIISGQNQIKQSSLPELKLFLERPEDLGYLINSQIFKTYLFREMSHELQNMKPEDFSVTLEEVSLEDKQLIIVFNHK